MAGKAKPITIEIFVGNQRVDKLTDEQKERMAQRLSYAMSLYYTQHPDEYAKLK